MNNRLRIFLLSNNDFTEKSAVEFCEMNGVANTDYQNELEYLTQEGFIKYNDDWLKYTVTKKGKAMCENAKSEKEKTENQEKLVLSTLKNNQYTQWLAWATIVATVANIIISLCFR